MLQNQLGFDKLLKEVFFIDDFKDTLNKENTCFKGSINSLEITKYGQNKIINYLKKDDNKVSIEILIAILSFEAHTNDISWLENAKTEYIQKNIEKIFYQLNNLIIDKNHINKKVAQYCLWIMEAKLSYALINNIVSLIIRSDSIFKEYNYYGLEKLLVELSTRYHNEFVTWYLNTNRKDLKTIFISIVVSHYNFFEFCSEKFSQSDIDFIKIISITIEYQLDKSLSFSNQNKTFIDLDSSKEENIYFLLYYYRYRSLDIRDKKDFEIFQEELKNIRAHIQHLNIGILTEYINQVDKSILANIVVIVDDVKKKEELIAELCTSMEKKLESMMSLSEYDVADANTYSFLIQNSENSSHIQGIEEQFVKYCEYLNTPYFFYRNQEQWQNTMNKLIYYLIIIFNTYSDKDTRKVQRFKQLYISTKRSFYLYNEEMTISILNQIN